MKVKLQMEKATKNTIRFMEELDGPFDTPKIGTIYVPKATLKEINYTEGKTLVVDISAE